MEANQHSSMESSALDLFEMIRTGRYDTDKEPSYLANYDALFAPLRNEPVCLLELGVLRGASLQLWHDYFPKGRIVGVDADPLVTEGVSGRTSIYRGCQEDLSLLDRIAAIEAPDGFDVIIDDAAHLGAAARASFWHLFHKHLKSGGIYSIEDWGTGYWEGWPDGAAVDFRAHEEIRETEPRRFPSHDYGMVGFVKELVDECGAADLTKRRHTNPPVRSSWFRFLQISHGQAIVVKA